MRGRGGEDTEQDLGRGVVVDLVRVERRNSALH